MSQHQHDLASACSPQASLSTTNSRPASSASSSLYATVPSTPWDAIIEEEVLRDLNSNTSTTIASATATPARLGEARRDLAKRLAKQYLEELPLLMKHPASPSHHRLKRKTRTPHRIAKTSSISSNQAEQRPQDPLVLHTACELAATAAAAAATTSSPRSPSAMSMAPTHSRVVESSQTRHTNGSLSGGGTLHHQGPRLTSVVEKLIGRLTQSPGGQVELTSS